MGNGSPERMPDAALASQAVRVNLA